MLTLTLNAERIIFSQPATWILTGKQVMDLLKKFHEETKTTIIVIMHGKDVADYAEADSDKDGVIAPANEPPAESTLKSGRVKTPILFIFCCCKVALAHV